MMRDGMQQTEARVSGASGAKGKRQRPKEGVSGAYRRRLRSIVGMSIAASIAAASLVRRLSDVAS